LAKRHAFKKWYLKLSMALLDVAMVNAEIHYFMVNLVEKKGMHRYNYREKLCSQLFDTDWSLYEGMTNNDVLEAICEGKKDEDASDEQGGIRLQAMMNNNVPACTPLMVNQYGTTNLQNEDTEETPVKTYKGVCCQVCLFEGRKTRTKSVAFCGKHGIRACRTTPNLMSYKDNKFKNAVETSTREELAMWRCPDVSSSCWSKAHSFYIASCLWGQQITAPPSSTNDSQAFRLHGVKISSAIYKNKEDWMLRHMLISKKGGTRGRKSKRLLPSTHTTDSKEPSTRKTKRRRQKETTTMTTPTIPPDTNAASIIGNAATVQANNDSKRGGDASDASSMDSLFLKEVTNHATV